MAANETKNRSKKKLPTSTHIDYVSIDTLIVYEYFDRLFIILFFLDFLREIVTKRRCYLRRCYSSEFFLVHSVHKPCQSTPITCLDLFRRFVPM